MNLARCIRLAYDMFQGRRLWLYIATLALLCICLLTFIKAAQNGEVRADIRTMLPEGEGDTLVRDFEMLSKSSLANNIFITVRASESASRTDLIAAANALSKQLEPPYFKLVDPTSIKPIKVMNFLLDNAPNLMSSDDLNHLDSMLTPEAIQTTLRNAMHQLTSPQGMIIKSFVRSDPLSFRSILAPRLKSLNVLSEASIVDGYLFSKDGKAILLTAQSSIPMTDADGAEQLIHQFDEARKSLPQGAKAEMISGHVHTLANASTIKSDLVTISLIALVALAVLFMLFFRSSHAIGIFLTPLAAMVLGLGALAMTYSPISAIVIGFGAVLIGISVDFAMHVYFAIARHNGSPGEASQAVARPILFCALTSCAAFGALFLSGIPGIRQLALFSITGLVSSALFSLLVLPHLCRSAKTVRQPKVTTDIKRRPQIVLILWALIMGVCVWFGSSVNIDPDLRNIGYVPEEVAQTERHFTETWGNMRNRAVIFSQGKTLDQSLAKNEEVHKTLAVEFPALLSTSIAPLMPSMETQAGNRDSWNAFWTEDRQKIVLRDLHEQSRLLGFSNKAFAPFENSLQRQVKAIVPDDLDKASLGIVKRTFLPESQSDLFSAVTFLPDSTEVQTFFSPEVESNVGVRLVSNGRFKTSLEKAMDSDITYFISISGLAVAVLAMLLFRNIRRATLALLPAATGILMVFGVLGLTDTPLNLFHITALPLIIGLGADYGIFLVSRETQLFELNTMDAVKVSGLTTLAGFGVLVLARHPSLHSLGITVLVGIGAALLCSLYMMPHLLRRQP